MRTETSQVNENSARSSSHHAAYIVSRLAYIVLNLYISDSFKPQFFGNHKTNVTMATKNDSIPEEQTETTDHHDDEVHHDHPPEKETNDVQQPKMAPIPSRPPTTTRLQLIVFVILFGMLVVAAVVITLALAPIGTTARIRDPSNNGTASWYDETNNVLLGGSVNPYASANEKQQQWDTCYQESFQWMIEPEKLQYEMDDLMLGGTSPSLSCEASSCIMQDPGCCEDDMKQVCEEDLDGTLVVWNNNKNEDGDEDVASTPPLPLLICQHVAKYGEEDTTTKWIPVGGFVQVQVQYFAFCAASHCPKADEQLPGSLEAMHAVGLDLAVDALQIYHNLACQYDHDDTTSLSIVDWTLEKVETCKKVFHPTNDIVCDVKVDGCSFYKVLQNSITCEDYCAMHGERCVFAGGYTEHCVGLVGTRKPCDEVAYDEVCTCTWSGE
jgi:hypothetical protein